MGLVRIVHGARTQYLGKVAPRPQVDRHAVVDGDAEAGVQQLVEAGAEGVPFVERGAGRQVEVALGQFALQRGLDACGEVGQGQVSSAFAGQEQIEALLAHARIGAVDREVQAQADLGRGGKRHQVAAVGPGMEAPAAFAIEQPHAPAGADAARAAAAVDCHAAGAGRQRAAGCDRPRQQRAAQSRRVECRRARHALEQIEHHVTAPAAR